MKYTISAKRKNLPGKNDYPWEYKYSNNKLITFDSREDALLTIDRLKNKIDEFPLYSFEVLEQE
jgi:hypothetical protein